MINFPAICVDNFYDDPDQMQKYASQLDYVACPEGSYPGLRAAIHTTNVKMLSMTCKRLFSMFYDLTNAPITWEVSSYFQKIYPMPGTAKYRNTGWIHADDNTVFAGIIYLNDNPDPSSGTSIYELKKDAILEDVSSVKHAFFKGETVDPDLYDQTISNHNSKFSETIRFTNKYNRMIAYDGESYHKADNFETGEGFRLSQVFFIKNVIAQYTPVPRSKQYH